MAALDAWRILSVSYERDRQVKKQVEKEKRKKDARAIKPERFSPVRICSRATFIPRRKSFYGE